MLFVIFDFFFFDRVWWVTVSVCTLIVSVVSELMCYFLHDLKDIEKT